MVLERRIAGLDACWLVVEPGRLGLWVPKRADDALEALAETGWEGSDERIPYFASLWPAGEALARHVLSCPEDLQGLSVLDLGCGVGVVGLAAAARGARVTFLDWEPRAFAFVEASAARQAIAPHACCAADWRHAEGLGRFDLVLAGDVLYEAPNVPAVAAFLAAHLSAGGEAWIADPRRPLAAAWPGAAAAAGLRLGSSERLPYRPRGVRVDLHRVTLGGGVL